MADEKYNNQDEEEVVEDRQDQMPDEENLEEVEESKDNKIQKLRQKLKSCEEEKRKYSDDLQRTKAEFLNSKRRLEEEKENKLEQAVNKHINQLLPLYDSFVMAMSNQAVWESVDENWRKGIENIYNQLKNILNEYKVTVVGEIGEDFNPNRHEAIDHEDSEAEGKEMVVEVIQAGFVREDESGNEHLIRPARVKVGNSK